MSKLTCLLFLFVLGLDTTAQVDQHLNTADSIYLIIYGTITDSAGKEALPFVDVRYEENLICYVQSDFDGHYRLKIPLSAIKNAEIVEIRFSFVGYDFPKIKVKTSSRNLQVNVQGRALQPQFQGDIKPYDPSADLKKMLAENKFTSIRKKKIPAAILNLLGYDSYHKVGTKQTQKGCTSGKRIMINWVEKCETGLYVISTSSCGAFSEDFCYIVYKGQAFDMHLTQNPGSFDDLKKIYLKKPGAN
jgi:hypothetical protein